MREGRRQGRAGETDIDVVYRPVRAAHTRVRDPGFLEIWQQSSSAGVVMMAIESAGADSHSNGVVLGRVKGCECDSD